MESHRTQTFLARRLHFRKRLRDYGVQILQAPRHVRQFRRELPAEQVPIQSWAIKPPLPVGLTLNPKTGVISGVPEEVVLPKVRGRSHSTDGLRLAFPTRTQRGRRSVDLCGAVSPSVGRQRAAPVLNRG